MPSRAQAILGDTRVVSPVEAGDAAQPETAPADQQTLVEQEVQLLHRLGVEQPLDTGTREP